MSRGTAEEQVVTPVPTSMAVRELFSDLVGREVEVSLGAPVPVPYSNNTFIAHYIDDTHSLAALAIVDLPLAGYLGGALSLLPVPSVTSAIEEGSLPDTAVEGLFEVLNVAASMFNIPGAPHVKLGEIIAPGQTVPLQAMALSNALGRRLDLQVTVPGYGRGHFSVVVNR